MSDRRTPLYGAHETAGARFTDFNGWRMPVEYEGIRTEHIAVRDAVGKFDVSHMGELEIGGPDATELCQRLTTNDVAALSTGAAQYSMITDERGVIIDDTVLYRFPEDGGAVGTAPHDPEAEFLVVPNAGNDERIEEWFREHGKHWNLDVTVANRTAEYALLAVQGPDAVKTVETTSAETLAGLGRFRAVATRVAGEEALVSRTGYTGEDGLEVFVAADVASDIWEAIDCRACGLGARDTLRLEMGYLLSGQDFHPEENPRTPFEANVGFTVELDTEFVGRDRLAEHAVSGPSEVLFGLRMEDPGIPRHGYEIFDGEAVIGTVTSGTMSPTLGYGIALGYLPVSLATAGTELDVKIRDARKTATTVDPPFIGAT